MRCKLYMFMILAVFTGAVRAETVDAEVIAQDMSSKLSRGVFNVLTGWGEIPRQMIISGREKGWWAVLPIGVPAGALMTVIRTGTGLFEIVTFCAPIDNTYGPLIDPAFVWQKASE